MSIIFINPYAYSLGIVTRDLLMHLDAGSLISYPGSGRKWYDISGNGHDATLVNGVRQSTSNGGYMSFDYTSGHAITASMQGYSYTHGITVAIWHYNGGGTGPYRGVATNGTITDRQGGFDLRYGRENYFGGSDNGTSLNWRIANAEGTASSRRIYANKNEWHYYAGTYDNHEVIVYKDGQLFDRVAHSGGGQLKSTTDGTMIGLSPGTIEYLDGRLAQISIYSRPLTQEEIEHNFNAVRSRFEI
jgi:hypothetical protein